MSNPVLERLAELEARVDALEIAAKEPRWVSAGDARVRRDHYGAAGAVHPGSYTPPAVQLCPNCQLLVAPPLSDHHPLCADRSVS